MAGYRGLHTHSQTQMTSYRHQRKARPQHPRRVYGFSGPLPQDVSESTQQHPLEQQRLSVVHPARQSVVSGSKKIVRAGSYQAGRYVYPPPQAVSLAPSVCARCSFVPFRSPPPYSTSTTVTFSCASDGQYCLSFRIPKIRPECQSISSQKFNLSESPATHALLYRVQARPSEWLRVSPHSSLADYR